MGVGTEQRDTGPPVIGIAAAKAECQQVFGRAVPLGIEPVELGPAGVSPVSIGLHRAVEPQLH